MDKLMLKIPLSFLRSLAVEKQLSEGELEVLYQIADNQPLEIIAKELATSLSAIHQRLAQMYSKFDIEGKGPGKLSRLQLLLASEYEKSLSSNGNLISSENNPSPSSYRLGSLVRNSLVPYNSASAKFARKHQPSDWFRELEQRIDAGEDIEKVFNEFLEYLPSALDYLSYPFSLSSNKKFLKFLFSHFEKFFIEQEKDKKNIPTAKEVQLPLKWIKNLASCTKEPSMVIAYYPMSKEKVPSSQDIKLQGFS
jgi:hypothetical protein